MRVLTTIAAILVLGCGRDPGSEGKGPTGPAPVYYEITGAIFDSVLSSPAIGLKVSVGDSVATTSDAGVFRVWQRAGDGFIRVDDSRFESLSLPFSFNHRGIVTLLLRGTAPYALRCQFRRDTVTALIVDLQGRKSMDRRTRTRLTTELNNQPVVRNADRWLWVPLDELTWSASVVLPDSLVPSVEWRLEDLDGNVRTASCDRSQVCTTCQGPQ